MSKQRVVVEHAIGRLKVFRILKDTFRGHILWADYFMWVIGGIANLKLNKI